MADRYLVIMGSVSNLYCEIRKINFGSFCAEILDFPTENHFLKISETLRKNSEGDPMAEMASEIMGETRNRSFRSYVKTSEMFMKIEKVFLVEKSRIKTIRQKLEVFQST